MNVVLVYASEVVGQDGCPVVGGAEKYLLELATAVSGEGLKVHIVQFGSSSRLQRWRYAEVHTLAWRPHVMSRKPTAQLETFLRSFAPTDTCVIFGSEAVTHRMQGYRTVLIQHGIGFDYPASGRSLGPLSGLRHTALAQLLVRYEQIRSAEAADEIVCVDYVYPTLFRTYRPASSKRLQVIPNFARTPPGGFRARNGYKRVLFARRMVERRGTEIMAEAARLLIAHCPEVEVTFAGEGPGKRGLQARFEGQSRVRFIDYSPDCAAQVHADHDIAVVPSLASEGTSFSLLEAMAAGCAVVATPVGGITNVIIHNHNGLLCEPAGESIFRAVCALRGDNTMAERLASTGFRTVVDSFSFERWRRQWLLVIRRETKPPMKPS